MSFTYKVEEYYLAGIPQTALPGGLQPRGIAMHWTAGATGRAGALGTAKFFVDRADRNASYHMLVYWEASTRVFGVMWIVPVSRAAHSMNPQPPTYAPNAEVKRILGDKTWDPNGASLAVSFCGMPADLEAAMQDDDFVSGYQRLVKELSAISSLSTRPLFNHGWAQPTTRTDAGAALIPAIYGETPEEDVITPEQADTPLIGTVGADSNIRKEPNLTARHYYVAAPRDFGLYGYVQGGSYTLSDGTTGTKWAMIRGAGVWYVAAPLLHNVRLNTGFSIADTVELTKKVTALTGTVTTLNERITKKNLVFDRIASETPRMCQSGKAI